MKLDAFDIQWWIIHLDWVCERITNITEQNFNNNDAESYYSWDSIIKDIEEHKKTLMELLPSDTLSPSHYNKDCYPLELIGQYIISELREKMNQLDEIGRENVLIGCLTGSTLIENYILYNEFDCGRETYFDWRKEMDNISPELSSFCHDAIEGAKWFAESIGDLIVCFNLDPQRLAIRLSDKIVDLIHRPSYDYFRKRKTKGKYLTVARQTLAIKELLGQLGITESNTDKTKIAVFATAIMGRNMDLAPQNNPVYEAVRKENSDKDWEVVKKLFEDVGLKDIAEKLK